MTNNEGELKSMGKSGRKKKKGEELVSETSQQAPAPPHPGPGGVGYLKVTGGQRAEGLLPSSLRLLHLVIQWPLTPPLPGQ